MKGVGDYPEDWPDISLQIRDQAGWRCVRCKHPMARWLEGSGDLEKHAEAIAISHSQPADKILPYRIRFVEEGAFMVATWLPCDGQCTHLPDGKQRVLTVHHLDGDKGNCRWWNIPALCQSCHLKIQAAVIMAQTYQLPHTGWFRPYAAGFYAFTILGEDLTREEVEGRMDELLNVGQPHLEPEQ